MPSDDEIMGYGKSGENDDGTLSLYQDPVWYKFLPDNFFNLTETD